MRLLFSIIGLAIASVSLAQTTISGTITDGETGEDLPFAVVYVKGTNIGVETNEYGFYSLTVKPELTKGDQVTIVFSFFGYQNIERVLATNQVHAINIELDPKLEQIDEVVVTADQKRQEKELRSTSRKKFRKISDKLSEEILEKISVKILKKILKKI